MKRFLIIIPFIVFTNLSFAQNPESFRYINQIELLIYQLQLSRPQITSSSRERDEFLKLFDNTSSIENYIFPELVGNRNFCLNTFYEPLNFYKEAFHFMRKRNGGYIEFTTDVGKASLPERFTGYGTSVNMTVKSFYSLGKDTLFSELKSVVNISLTSNNNFNEKRAKISSIKLKEKDVYLKKWRNFAPEFHLSLFQNSGRPSFSLFDNQFFTEQDFSNELGIKFEAIIGKKIHWGIGVGYYQQTLNVGRYGLSSTEFDPENEEFIRTISGNNLVESSQIFYVSVPIYYDFTPISNRKNFSFEIGVNSLIPVMSKFTGEGQFNYEAYYPQLNFAPEEEIPELGILFNENVQNSNIDYRTSPTVFIHGGITYDEILKIGSWGLGLGFYINIPLNNIISRSSENPLTTNSEMFSGINNFTQSNFITPMGIKFNWTLPKFKKIKLAELCLKEEN